MNEAKALIDIVLNNNIHPLYRGTFLLFESELFGEYRQWDRARSSAEQAQQLFEQLALYSLEALSLEQQSWSYLPKSEFREATQVLNKAVNRARLSNDVLLERDLLLNLSVMAFKNREEEMAFSILDLAEQITQLHRESELHQVAIASTKAYLSQNSDEKLSLWQSVTALPYSENYYRDFYISAELALQQLIKQQRWQQANELIKPWQRASFRQLMLAKIALSKDKEQGIELAEEAYQYAVVAHHTMDALNTASLLLEQLENKPTANAYRTFIKQHAPPRWYEQNAALVEKHQLERQ